VLSFADTDNHWAKDYINILSSNGITICSQGHFNPNDQVSRMHYATFIYRIVKYKAIEEPRIFSMRGFIFE
jgi:hypothetical protein